MTSLPSSLASLFIHDDLWCSGRRNTASRGVATPDATSIYSGAGGGGGGGVNSTIFRLRFSIISFLILVFQKKTAGTETGLLFELFFLFLYSRTQGIKEKY